MSGGRKRNLRMVKPKEKEAGKKRRRRRWIWILAVLVAAAAVVAAVAYFVTARGAVYYGYVVTSEVERADTPATHYLAFGDGYVKYSNDGASYVTSGGDTAWTQSYELENPIVAVCDPYIAFADRQGEKVYVLNRDGLQGEISVNMPISKIDVASQGNVALLTMDGGTGYLFVFDKKGASIAEGAIYVENTGTPMDIAISSDGKNLAAAIVDVSTGSARTTINFYNFGATGQRQTDNMVGTFRYEDTIVPEICYTDKNTLLAFADTGVYVFKGGASPEEKGMVEAEDEIQSIFYDDGYFGLVYNNASGDVGRVIRIYDAACTECASIESDFSYDTIVFLNNHEICLYSSDRCDIYTLSGFRKFSETFDEPIAAFFHRLGYRNYLLLKENSTERIRLNL